MSADQVSVQVMLGNERHGFKETANVASMGLGELHKLMLSPESDLAIVDPVKRELIDTLITDVITLADHDYGTSSEIGSRPALSAMRDRIKGWMGVMWPVINSANATIEHIDASLTQAEKDVEEDSVVAVDADLPRLIGVATVMASVMTAQVDAPHPRELSDKVKSKVAQVAPGRGHKYVESVDDSSLLELTNSKLVPERLSNEIKMMFQFTVGIAQRIGLSADRFNALLHALNEKQLPKYEETLERYEKLFSGKLTDGWDELHRFLISGPNTGVDTQLFTSPAKENAKLITRFLRALAIEQEIVEAEGEDFEPIPLIDALFATEAYLTNFKDVFERHGDYSSAAVTKQSMEWLRCNREKVLASGLMNSLSPSARVAVSRSLDSVSRYFEHQDQADAESTQA